VNIFVIVFVEYLKNNNVRLHIRMLIAKIKNYT